MSRAQRVTWLALAASAILLGSVAVPQRADAIVACEAEDITNTDPGCPPGTGTCTITQVYEVEDGCELDFSERDVVMAANSVLNAGDGSITLLALSLVMQPRSTIFGTGDLGPSLCITTAGDMRVERVSGGRAVIDASGDDLAGCAALTVGGNLTIDGEVIANQTAAGGSGGEVVISVDGNMTTGTQSTIAAVATGVDSSGGNVDISVIGNAQLTGAINATGGEGGTATVVADGNATVGAIDVRSNRLANDGGSVDITAGLSATINGNMNLNASGPDEQSGAVGGFGAIEALFGDLTINARLNADGSSPDGGGGEWLLEAEGNFVTASNAVVSATSLGVESAGGTIEINAGIDVIHAGSAPLSGGTEGGSFFVFSDRSTTVSGSVDVKGRDAGSFAGPIEIEAGPDPSAFVRVTGSGLLDAQGGRCSFDLGCGAGGSIDLTGCDIDILSGARLFAFAGDGGAISLAGNKSVRVAGRVDATTTTPSQGDDGTIDIEFPIGNPANLVGSTITPPADQVARTVCTQAGQQNCVRPCPTCGNGVVEFPESCDLGVPTPVNCNGCSSSCQLQECDDNRICTENMCDPRLGCFFVQLPPPCMEPTNTPTITRTPTITPTPTLTGSPTLTGTPTLTGSPTNTPTVTPTPSITATVSQTPTTTPTNTPGIGRPGDANCDDQVNEADRVALVAAIFETTDCPGVDVNRDDAVSAADIAALISEDPR